MLKITKHKKGFLANTIVILICFVVFAFVGFIFYILFGLAGKIGVYDMNIKSDLQSSDASYALINYLRTPIEVNGNKINMADLIVSSFNDNNYDSVEFHTERIFNTKYAYYWLEIKDTEGNRQFKKEKIVAKNLGANDVSNTKVIIPNPQKINSPITIYLVYSPIVEEK